jgi:large-conductance mechanosensitive channel
MVHIGVAMVIGIALIPAIDSFVEASVSPLVRAIVITFVVGLPALIYALLTSIWVILIAQGAMRRHH